MTLRELQRGQTVVVANDLVEINFSVLHFAFLVGQLGNQFVVVLDLDVLCAVVEAHCGGVIGLYLEGNVWFFGRLRDNEEEERG